MEECILTIGTVTQAIRARKQLTAVGIGSRLVKGVSNAKTGCTYGVSVRASDMQQAMHTLKESQIAFEWSRGRASGNR